MKDFEKGRKRAQKAFLRKESKPDNYLKGIIKNCSSSLEFRKKDSFAENVKWAMRAFSMNKETATSFEKSCRAANNAYDKELIKLAKNELKKRGVSDDKKIKE